MHPRAQELIATLGLEPHPEGGWYWEVFRSEELVTRRHDGAERRALTTIHFLLVEGTFSRWHRVQSDEAWHFYEGDPLELTIRDEPPVVLDANHRVHVVPARKWQTARPLGAYAFVGCTVAPGFVFEDFEM